MQRADTALEEARRKKDRDEILHNMERLLDQIKDEREAFERRLDQKDRTTAEQVEQILAQEGVRAQKADEKVARLQRETISTLQRIEEKVEESMLAVENRVDLSSKAIQTMTTVAIFGFAAVTVALMVLFFTLMTGI